MKIIKKVLSAFTAAAMSATVCMSTVSSLGTAVAADDMTAIQLVNDMGMGWNLGNTFDAWNVNGAVETGWGNIKTTQAIIDTVHDYGFDSVRIPITWYEHTDLSTYDIDDDYLSRVKEVIDYCYANDMYVIINMHWDWVSNGSLWLNKGLDAEAQFKTMWTEIATYFKDYDNHLVFEDMNEVKWSSGSTYTASDYTTLNTLNQDFVDVVRATGGNNSDRLLLLAGANADLSNTCSTSYVLPKDDMIAVDIHYYTPAEFCVRKQNDTWGVNQTTWGTNSDLSNLANDFSKLKQNFVDKGVPIILGEYGVLTNEGKEDASIKAFIEAVAGTALETDGFASFLWDDSDSGGHEYFSRKNLKFHNDEFGKVFIDLADNGYVPPTIDWVEVEINDEGKFQIGNATKFKLEFSSDYSATLGAGGTISYWDEISGTNKQNAISFSISELDGELLAHELGEADEDGNQPIVQYGYINVPQNVTPANVYINIYWAGYNTFDDDGNWLAWNNLTSDEFPQLVKAYIPGVVEGDKTVYGDADLNGDVEIADAVKIMCYVTDPENNPIDPQGIINGDVYQTGDGLSVQDALSIQKYLAQIITSLPETA